LIDWDLAALSVHNRLYRAFKKYTALAVKSENDEEIENVNEKSYLNCLLP